ncbi:MAG: hypothetical protein JW795_12955 [Chitinivibrionales bacterium]|nr:hypothetical protein [Chitinivibrionales bacterium]
MTKSSHNYLFQSIAVVFIVQAVTKVFGFLRDVILTNQIGVGLATDAFYSVNIIVEAIIVLSGLQAFFSFTTSSFSKLRVENSCQTMINQYYTSFLLLAIGISLVLTMVVLSIPETVVAIALQGLDQTGRNYAKLLLLISASMIVFSTIVRILASLMGVERMFLWQNLFLLFINIGSVVVVVLAPHEQVIYILAIQIVLFNIFSCLGQILLLWRRGYRFTRIAVSDFRATCAAIVPFILPLTLVTSFESFSSLVERNISSFYQAGIITALSLSQNLTYFSISAIFVSIIRVVFPEFAKLYFSNKHNELSHLFNRTYSFSFFIFFPIAMFIVFFCRELVSGLYFRKNFTAEDVEIMCVLLPVYGFALIGNIHYQLPSFLLQSIQKNKIVGITGCISYSVTIGTMVLLSNLYGFRGIPMGSLCGFSVFALLLYIMLYRSIRITINRDSVCIICLVIAATAIGVIVCKNFSFDFSRVIPSQYLSLMNLFVKLTFFIVVWTIAGFGIRIFKIPFSLTLKG